MENNEYITFVFQAEDGIRALVRSRGLGDVYKGQGFGSVMGWHSRIGLATGSDFGSRWLMDFEMGFDWPKLTDFGTATGLRSCLGWCLPMVRKRGLIPLPPKPTNYHSRCYNLP